jgi:hypothetical protein
MYCLNRNIQLNMTWIPRDLNQFADAVSRFLDTDDYGVTDTAYFRICNDFELDPV